MNKCIANSDCPTSYCKEQCFGCGSECWWLKNNVYSNLKQENDFLGCIRRDEHVTVLFKQKSTITNGDYLGRLVLGVEDGEIKIFGATIF